MRSGAGVCGSENVTPPPLASPAEPRIILWCSVITCQRFTLPPGSSWLPLPCNPLNWLWQPELQMRKCCHGRLPGAGGMIRSSVDQLGLGISGERACVRMENCTASQCSWFNIGPTSYDVGPMLNPATFAVFYICIICIIRGSTHYCAIAPRENVIYVVYY